ncbi:MAG: hypothetical protein IJM21_08270 [Clostridia bacterium]|nr:hypothetical protein [Clostridia bacterium]
MDLETLYGKVRDTIRKLDFESIWPGFRPLKFALYDEETCFFDGRFVEKTDAFTANTSIVYNGEQIAIWMVAEELPISVLTSKIVHEMFHGFQTVEGWDCWAHELEALSRYAYSAENLSVKLRENELLLSLRERPDKDGIRELLAHRKYRQEKFPYEFAYESEVEEIEGTANYVEWQVLGGLDPEKAAELEDGMRRDLAAPESLFPVRISCYAAGALLIDALRGAGLYDFDPVRRPAILPLLENAASSGGSFPGKDGFFRALSDAAAAYDGETERIVREALRKNEIVLKGPCALLGVNVWNARHVNGYLTTTHFLMVRDGEENRLLRGDFVLRMRDEWTVEAVWRM